MDNDSTIYWDSTSLPPKWMVWILLVLAGTAIATIGAFRPGSEIYGYGGKPTDAFWDAKLLYRNPDCNMLLIGNSRILRALDPGAFEAAFPGTVCYNYAFPGLKYHPTYLRHADAIISNSQRHPRRILAGICDMNFFIPSGSQFDTTLEALPKYPMLHFPRLQPLPFDTQDTPLGTEEEKIEAAHANGWIASDTSVRDPNGVPKRWANRRKPRLHKVSREDWAPFIQSVRQWTDEGIRVYAFIVPISPEMTAAQNKRFDFDYDQFLADFKAAGGVWIPVDPTPYETYDGSHLVQESAEQFSRELAKQIGEIEHASQTSD
jgi:hypothetical protein